VSEVQILVTGEKCTGQGFRALEPVIEELIGSAKVEVHVIAYLLSPFAVGFMELLERAMERGVSVTLIVNALADQPEQIKKYTSKLVERFPSFTVKSFDRSNDVIHAKVLIIDRRIAIVGSANLTWGGLVSNHEICVLVRGEPAFKIAALLDSI